MGEFVRDFRVDRSNMEGTDCCGVSDELGKGKEERERRWRVGCKSLMEPGE